MIDTTKTLQESLDELQVVGKYVWKPQRFKGKYVGEYTANVDVVSDGSAQEIEDAVTEAASNAIEDIDALKAQKIRLLRERENDYMNLMANAYRRYQEMYIYFHRVTVPPLATIMATAMANLNNL